MPYVPLEKRDNCLKRLQIVKKKDEYDFGFDGTGLNVGEVTYLVYLIYLKYFHLRTKFESYHKMIKSAFNCDDITACKIAALLEFNRRHMSKYEDKKIEENGDVFHEEGGYDVKQEKG